MSTLPEATYEDYCLNGGCRYRDVFEASLTAAKAAVQEVIGFNTPKDEADEQAYIRAVCAAVDVDVAYGQSAGIADDLSSFSIGSFSAGRGSSTSQSAISAYDLDMRRVIRRELVGSSLLFQGIA